MSKSLQLGTILKNPEIQAYIKGADNNFAAIGYKEHGFRHAQFTAKFAGMILDTLKYSARQSELARIAGYLHDIGNCIRQEDHAQNGAIMVIDILERMKIPYPDIFELSTAIGSHEDKHLDPPSVVAAAVVLADKADLHHSRVRTDNLAKLDKHGKINHACQRAFLQVKKETKTIKLELEIDAKTCSVLDYFELFLEKTKFCQKASKVLGCEFALEINSEKML